MASTVGFLLLLAAFVAVQTYPFPPKDESNIQHVVDGKCTKSSWSTSFGHCECKDGKVKCFFRPGGMMPHGPNVPRENLIAIPYPFPPEDETHIQHVVDGKCTKDSWRTTFGHCECQDGKVKCFFRPGGMIPHGPNVPRENLIAIPYPFPPEDETHIQHVVDGKCTKDSWRTTFGHCECKDGKVKCFFRPGGMMPHGPNVPHENLQAIPYPFPPEDETHVQHVVDGKCTKESWNTVTGHCTCKDGKIKCFFYPGGMKPLPGLLQLYYSPSRYNNTRPYYPNYRPNYPNRYNNTRPYYPNNPYQRYNASRHGYPRIHFF